MQSPSAKIELTKDGEGKSQICNNYSEKDFEIIKVEDPIELFNEIYTSSESSAYETDGGDNEDLEFNQNTCLSDFNLIADALESENKGNELNKTFSEMQLRDIERKNAILMNKILYHSQRTPQYKAEPSRTKVASSAVNRKKDQKKIERDNMLLLKRIKSVKPFGMSKPK